MQHKIDWNAPAKLVHADHVSQFGDGYRQISGTRTLATGSVDELLVTARSLSQADQRKVYFISDTGVVPLTIEEVEVQRP